MGKEKITGTKSLKLTEDLIMDIISRVSEKDFMRFMCLSKSWRSLVNTDLYLSQLRSLRTALQGRPFLIIGTHESLLESYLYYNYWIELDSIEDGNPKPREIHNPFDDDCPRRDARVIASCEGLLVLEQQVLGKLHSGKMGVLNPATKKHHVVPPNPAGDDNVVLIGFGYDHVHGCYKLVTKIKHESRDNLVELMIYNVNNRTWKKSRFEGLDKDCSVKLCNPGDCVDGALYWHTESFPCTHKMEKILCFVLAEEEFHEVDPPHCDEVMYNSVVTVFDGRRLCLVCGPCDDMAEFWLMECDYQTRLGSSYSWRWIKFLSPDDFNGSNLIPICFSACKRKVLFTAEEKRLLWYDIKKDEFDEVKSYMNKFSDGYIDVIACVPSLVGIGKP